MAIGLLSSVSVMAAMTPAAHAQQAPVAGQVQDPLSNQADSGVTGDSSAAGNAQATSDAGDIVVTGYRRSISSTLNAFIRFLTNAKLRNPPSFLRDGAAGGARIKI